MGKGPEGIDLSPDGMEVWAANSGDGTVSIIDTASKKVKQTVNVGTKHSNRLKFTPDGKLALISDIGSGDLVVMDAVGFAEGSEADEFGEERGRDIDFAGCGRVRLWRSVETTRWCWWI